jgi:uncharacterized protein (TIGR03083 family)
MTMTTDDDLQPEITATYVALAELLDALPAPRWDIPSLCDGWRVREVVAHLTMPARYSADEFMAELHKDSFDFTRLSNRIASRDAALPASVLVENLRDEALHRWTPPGGGKHGALNHVVVHSLDITVPLDEPRRASDAAIHTVLDDLTAGGGHAHFGTDIQGRTLLTTDIDWSYGSGPQLRGTAADVTLHICGRATAGRLDGGALTRLSEA